MSACTKISYQSRGEAKHMLRLVRGRRGMNALYAYPCPRCGLWHLGRKQKGREHKRLRRKRRKQQQA